MATPVEHTGEPAVGSAASAEEIVQASMTVAIGKENTVGGVDGAIVEMRVGKKGQQEGGSGKEDEG